MEGFPIFEQFRKSYLKLVVSYRLGFALNGGKANLFG